MRRRSVLKGIAAVIAARAALLPRVPAGATTSAFTRARPGDPAWPSAAGWARLNEAVGGNLIAVPSPFGACATDPGG
jgi:hypothetical protein